MSSKKKIVFIQPYYRNVWESIGIGYIISYCKKYFPEYQYEYYQGNFDEDYDIIEGCQDADIVAFSCTSPCFDHAYKLAGWIRNINPQVHFVFGGWHITALREKLWEKDPDNLIDQIVIGEGEEAFKRILGGDRSKIVTGSPLGFDELLWPDREAIKNHRTIDLCESMNGHRTTSFQSNRVCPVSCIFCAEKIMTGKFNKRSNPVRSRNHEDTCAEIKYVAKKYNLDYFKFVDATFDVTPEFVIEFCKEKLRQGIDLEWECLIHASFCTEEMFEWLKRSNCNQINVGVESGSDKVLKKVGKGTKREIVQRVFEWGAKFNIERRAFFILGMPNETQEDIALTEDLIETIKPDVVGFTVLCPYPGSKLYEHDKHKDIPWHNTDEYSNDFWRNDALSNEELRSEQKRLTKKYANIACERVKLGNTDLGII